MIMQEKKPLVTIVTITFNLIKSGREKTFRQCLESVHSQTYKNIEHIVVDGASKDGTVDLIKEYADKGWVKYISEPDSGIYDAMNKGIEMANGKYIAFLNSDDFYNDKNGISISMEALEKSNADFSYAPARIVNENDSELDYRHPQTTPDIKNVFYCMPFCHQTMLVKKDVVTKNGMFDTDFKSAGDYDFVLRLCLNKSKFVFVEYEFVTYRLGGLSASNMKQSIKEMTLSYLNNYKKIAPITLRECRKMSRRIYYENYYVMPKKLAEELKKFEPYFDYKRYLENARFIIYFKKKSEYLFNKSYKNIKFVMFSPRKCAKKYISCILNGRARGPVRRFWYALRFKKLK